ncbi:MAG TPA: YbaK/EbsC family protein [Candidatus Xenobia bacterium]|nr:YbaK/EbsC family protein [Candidatus Xenobia bacterium]
MISQRLKDFLDRHEIGYDVMHHDPAFTAQELAARMHISGFEFTKVVVVKLDGQFALAALPAPLRINFKDLARVAGAKKCQLASEKEFQQFFPDCELGAMPPFGNLYQLPTYADEDVSRNENIVINAGTHAEAIRLRYSDFARLAAPRVGRFAEPPPAEVLAQKKSAATKARRKAKAKAKANAKKAKARSARKATKKARKTKKKAKRRRR